MSSGIDTPPLLPPETPVFTPPSESEVLIQRRIEQTGRHVKGVDIADGLMTLAIGGLAYLLAVAAIDHWLIPGGLEFWGRLGLWLLLMGTVGAFFVIRLLPPLIHRINPLFAATTIEQSRPSLKNSLINFLLFRRHRQNVAPIVYQAMERRAAADLTEVELDVAVDRTHVIRLGFVLVGVFALFCLYLVISPKNPIRSAGRVLWPWSNIEAPTRVTIRDVQPGNTMAFLGEFVTVSAELSGLDDGEPALAIYSTADGQTVDQEVPMTLPEGDYRHQCRLPPGNLGLQQDITYYLAAGDCKTLRYRIESQVAPTIVVDQVLYRYPEYTGLADRTVERQGDLRAIEGTEATIHASANTEIKPGTAEIDRGCTGRQGIRMTTDGRTAVGHLTLRLHPKDASAAEFDSYQLRFADREGRENTRPIRHRIDVIRDLPPEVQWIEPQQEEVQVPLGGALAIRVRAEDPDFGLRRVVLRAQCNNKSLPIAPLLDRRKPARARTGEFTGNYTFEPQRLKLKVGDRVEYWVEAQDNREPAAGEGVSGKQWIVVVDSEQQNGDNRTDETASEDNTAGGDRTDNKAATDGRADNAANEKQSQKKTADNKPNEQPDAPQTPSEENQSKQPNESAKKSPQEKSSDSSNGDQGKGDASSGKAGEEDRQQQGNEPSTDQRQGDQQGEKNNQRIDPEAAPGDAMQEILNDRQKEQEQKQSKENQSKSDDHSSEAVQSNEQKAGEKGEEGEKGVKDNAESQQGGAGEQGTENAGDEKSGNEKAGEKNGNESTESQQGGAGEQDTENAGDEKSGNEKAGEKNGNENTDDEQGRAGESDKGKTSETGSDKPTDDGQPDTKPGEGKNVGNDTGSPAPQNQNLDREKKPGKAGEEPGKSAGDMAQSPSTSKHQSDSQGETAGDRSGGGEQGGGQKADQPGGGAPGSHTSADEGGSQADEPGEGEIGKKAGDQNIANQPTDSATKTPVSKGIEGEKGMKGKKGEKGEKGEAGGKEGVNAGMPGGGGKPGTPSSASTPPESDESSADQANLEYARRQTELALEHLRDQLAKENPKLLERLGWTKDDAQHFLNRWESMRRAAAEQGPVSENARKQLNDALQSLGLRPRGTELRHGGIPTDQPQNLRDAGRFAPPSDWAEQFREYTRGVAGGGERREERGEGEGNVK